MTKEGKDKILMAAAKLYHNLLPNGGSFHDLSNSTRTKKEFLKLAEYIMELESKNNI